MKKVNRYPEECAIFLNSNELNTICEDIAKVDNHEELKLNFTQLFLRDVSSNGISLSAILSPSISWVASDSLELSDTCSQVLTLLAAKDISTADVVVTQIMLQLEVVKDDSTKYLRYLCLLASFMKISSEYFLLCEAKGATAVVIASVSSSQEVQQQLKLLLESIHSH